MNSRPQIEQMIINALAAQKRCSPAELRRDLEAKGDDMPEDSHRLVRVVAKLCRELGAPPIKWRKELRPAFKSVRALAALLFAQQSATRAA
jgi:hypothetical protein